jgi:hypothetical protein
MLGVTSIVRALNLNARYYNALVDHFRSAPVKLDQLTAHHAMGSAGVTLVPAARAHHRPGHACRRADKWSGTRAETPVADLFRDRHCPQAAHGS